MESCHHLEDENEREHGLFVWEHKDPKQAAKLLCDFIDEHHLLDSDKGPRHPLVILAFDEAQALTDNPPNNECWPGNLFSELRRVLHKINDFPIFSIFLSTSGHFDQFSPETRSDPSARVRQFDYPPLDPIIEVSFDDIAYTASKGTITLANVIEIGWISHLGRPLYVLSSHTIRELLSYQLE